MSNTSGANSQASFLTGPSSLLPDFSKYGFVFTGLSIAGIRSGWDGYTRLNQYVYPLQAYAQQVHQRLATSSGQLNHVGISHDAFNLRNKLLELTRRQITSGGLAMSEYIKAIPLTYEKISQKYGSHGPGSFAHSKAIVEAATRNDPAVTAGAKRMCFIGVSALIIPTLNLFQIYRAPTEDRVWGLVQMGSQLIGGTVAERYGVSALWGAMQVSLPWTSMKPLLYGQTGKGGTGPVLFMHMVFRVAMSTGGAGIGNEAFHKLKSFWEEQGKK